jgi:hypothetical protein
MPQQFSNNARSTLTSTISDSATSLTVQPAAADLFPTANVGTGSIPSADNWFKATLQDVTGNVEIIYVRTRNAGSAVFSNILRAQEGTTAREFVSGSVVGLRVTAADINATINIRATDNTFFGLNTFDQPIVGDLTGDVTGNVTGDVTGNVTGDVTGDVTGNLTGDVTGDVTGNLTGTTVSVTGGVTGSKLDVAKFTLEESGGKLVFISRPEFTASISGTVMTVTVASPGMVNHGAVLTGTGVTAGTTIGAQRTSTETAAATVAYASGGEVGETQFVVASATGISSGQMISGIGVPVGTFVALTYDGSTLIQLADRTNTPIALTLQAAGDYVFAAASGKGTYTVSASQTVSSTTLTGTKTVAALSYSGVLTTANNVTSHGNP